jgi:hypothetical protein
MEAVAPRDVIKSKIIGRNTTTAEAVEFLKMLLGAGGMALLPLVVEVASNGIHP